MKENGIWEKIGKLIFRFFVIIIIIIISGFFFI